MKSVIIFRILAGIILIVSLIFFFLHLIYQYDFFWFSLTIAISSILNLIASVKYLIFKKSKKERKKKTGDGSKPLKKSDF